MDGSTQRPAQSTWPLGHEVAQLPAAHTSPALHIAPALAPAQSIDAPQKTRSVFGSTQRPPQAICPAGQLVSQIPAAQTSPAPQVTPALAPPQSIDAPQ